MRSNEVWPMQPGGGLFLISIGLGLLYGAFARGGAVFLGLEVGFIVGVAGIIVGIVLAHGRFGRPITGHRMVVFGAIAFEIVAFTIMARRGLFRGQLTPATWAALLSVVSLHFIPMRWSHGPLILWLALAGLGWIGFAYFLHWPLAVIAGDALLKIGLGVVMAFPLWMLHQEQRI
jgi:uncharacterized protein DUF6609